MGSAKAAVLPLPVWEDPITLRPAKIAGMHAACTCVGAAMPSFLQVLTSQSVTPKQQKLPGASTAGTAAFMMGSELCR